MDGKEYIAKEVLKFHKQMVLESELKKINGKLNLLKEGEGEGASTEEKSYNSNVYESYKKDLEEVVSCLTDACNKLESASLKQDRHITTIPEVMQRTDEAKKHKEILLSIYKEVKGANVATEKRLYEMQ